MRKIVALAAGAAAFVASPGFAAVGGIVDGSFETQGAAALNGNGDGYCYANNNGNGLQCATSTYATTPWIAANNGGFAQNGNFAFGGNTPDGSYFGFIQGTGSLSQTFTASSTGNFALDFLAAGRSDVADGNQTFNVLLNNAIIGTGATTTNQAFTLLSSSLFSLVAGGSYTLSFQGTDLHGGDNTAFIDNVSLRAVTGAVPEPATWAMMLLGFGAIGFVMRRKRAPMLARA